jgi:hypothetical protein
MAENKKKENLAQLSAKTSPKKNGRISVMGLWIFINLLVLSLIYA